jgi:hypothetical protein
MEKIRLSQLLQVFYVLRTRRNKGHHNFNTEHASWCADTKVYFRLLKVQSQPTLRFLKRTQPTGFGSKSQHQATQKPQIKTLYDLVSGR